MFWILLYKELVSKFDVIGGCYGFKVNRFGLLEVIGSDVGKCCWLMDVV